MPTPHPFTLDNISRTELMNYADAWAASTSNDRNLVNEQFIRDVEHLVTGALQRVWSAPPLMAPEPTPPLPEFSTLTVAEVRAIERDKTVMLIEREVAKLKTSEPSSSRSYGTKPREASALKAEVHAILNRLLSPVPPLQGQL